MTDKNLIKTRSETKEIRSRVSKLSQKKLKTNINYGRKQARCLSLSASLYFGKAVRTAKHRSTIFNGCSKGESPSEAETPQDIIWDSASPPPLKNGKGAGESIRVVEISEIVNRIAPSDERPVNDDSVLQWIGDTAFPCTPEIQQTKVQRCLARRQSNNVEDLMKLAKQFDLNMTRQHKKSNLQNSEKTDCKDLHRLSKLVVIPPESENDGASAKEAEGLHHEEELHALFDGPTQHLKGRLSPPSANCSQKSMNKKIATHGIKLATSDSKNLPEDPQVSKPDFEDDWENDNILSDFFVLEVTQNPCLLSSCTAKTTGQLEAASRNCESTMVASFSSSSSKAGCPQSHQIASHCTKISSKTGTISSTFRSDSPVQSGAVKQLSETSSDLVNTNSKAPAIGRRQQMVMTSVCPGVKGLTSLAGASGKEMDSLWGDDAYNNLLYQACDDLERISASQEQQRDKNSSKPSYSSAEVPSSIMSNSSSNMSRNSRTVQCQHPTDYKQPVCVFARSHSIPGSSAIYNNKQNLTKLSNASQVNQCPQNTGQQYLFTQLRHGTVHFRENSYPSTFKRHQSDPGALRNKVQPAVMCSAAEIERKKQEALARRRLRLQAT